MLVCDVSAIDRLIDMYGENLSVVYNNEKYLLYDLREKFVDENVECSLENYISTSKGIVEIENKDAIIISINSQQDHQRDDILNL
jgi:hypothetical protein